MKLAVYGASSALIDEIYIKTVEDFCEQAGKKGHTLVFGCGSSGLMGAAARGFKKANAFIHGVIPHFFEENGYEAIFYDADKITRTKTMAERKAIMEDECDAFIIAPGSIGTYEEFFQAITLKQLGRHNKPILLLNIKGYFNKLDELMAQSINQNFMTEKCKKLYKIFDNGEDILTYLETAQETPSSWDEFKIIEK